MTKKCSKCKEVKPVAEYYKRSASKDGLFYQCKTCKGKTSSKYQQTDAYKAYKANYGKRPEVRAKQAQWREDKKSKLL